MIEPFQLPNRQMLIAPLGVRFWDVTTGAYVTNGLRVTAYRDDRLHLTQASPNRSGTYVLHHASGLREFEMGVGNTQFTDSSPARQPFTVEVRDEERRFLPVKFEADLPCKGLFNWQETMTEHLPLDPPNAYLGVPLYSSTLRTAPAGMAVIRAELYESPGEAIDDVRKTRPAAWAMLEARSGGRFLGRGIADEKGRIALIFVYPAPHDSISSLRTSPAGASSAGLPFRQQEWTIRLQAYYEPRDLSSPPAQFSPPQPLSPSSKDEPGIPILRDILKQSPVNLFLDEAQTELLTEVTLMYGPKVFVAPSNSPLNSPPNPVPLSVLFISPAGSPPS